MSPENVTRPSPKGSPKNCPECNGRGWNDSRCPTLDWSTTCLACKGRGTISLGDLCSGCHGTGQIATRPQDKTIFSFCNGTGVCAIPSSMTEADFAYRPRMKM